MRNIYITLFSCTLLLISLPALSQTIRVVNNNPELSIQDAFTSVQAAIDASVNDDIIHIISSPDSYGNFTLNKRLKIYGIGHGNALKEENFNFRSIVGTITMDTISISGQESSSYGSQLESLEITRILEPSSYITKGITIRNCSFNTSSNQTIGFNNPTIPTSRNINIEGCVFLGGSSFYQLGNNSADITIRNSIIHQGYFYIINQSTVLFENCLFTGRTSTSFSLQIYKATFRNCIFYEYTTATTGGSSTGQGVSFENCLAIGSGETSFTLGDNSATGTVSGDPLFIDAPIASMTSTFNYAWDFRLQGGSPALGSGVGGVDLGIFGNSFPFDIFGFPRLPRVTEVIIGNSYLEEGQNLNISIKAKGGGL